METAAKRGVLGLAARFLEAQLNRDRSDHVGSDLPCSCGQGARYVGRRAKRFTTVLGPLTLERAYYHCDPCGAGFCPRDRVLGLEGSSLSPAVVRMVGLVGAMVSFEEGGELIRELAGLDVDAKRVERTAEALGREIAQDEREVAEMEASTEIPPTLYLGLDGTGIPMRAEALQGRSGKQPDGSAKTREVKLCVVWSAEGRDKDGVPVRDEGSVTYSAAIESAAETPDGSPSELAQRALREAGRRGFDQAQRRVVLGDGAAWIWNLADTHFPGAIQIVDRFHVKEHLSAVAKAIWGPDGGFATRWAKERHLELDEGQLDTLLKALEIHAEAVDGARKCRDYIQRNRARMRYREFREQGLCTSTGVVEAGCKVAIGTRLKRAGMHWTEPGANAIIALRCAKLSGRLEGFWERRQERSAA